MALVIHVDGGSRGNPGPAGAGVCISTEGGGPLFEAGFFLGHQTNNVAEYMALIRALERVSGMGAHTLQIRSDSELLVRQVTGQYRVKNERLQELYADVQRLLLRVSAWHFRHVMRADNSRADELANMAMDRKADVIVLDLTAAADAGDSGASGPAAGKRSRPASKRPGHGPAAAPASASAESNADADVDGNANPPRAVRVTLVRAPGAACPAGLWCEGGMVLRHSLPGGMCLHAAHALAPTVLAIQNTAPEEFLSVPALTVRCGRTGCQATFQAAPQASTNGAH